jgi:hypothetical protein
MLICDAGEKNNYAYAGTPDEKFTSWCDSVDAEIQHWALMWLGRYLLQASGAADKDVDEDDDDEDDDDDDDDDDEDKDDEDDDQDGKDDGDKFEGGAESKEMAEAVGTTMTLADFS